MDDLLDMYLGSDEVPFKEEPKKESGNFKSKGGSREDLWNETNFDKKQPDRAKFNKTGKSFLVVLAGTPDDVSKSYLNKLVSALSSRNHVMRYQFNNHTDFYKELTDIEGVTVEAYLPWKKMAQELANVKRTFASKLAYETAAYYAPKFSTFPPAVRCIRANAVHALLGEKVDNPVDLILTWSECGTEVISRDTDFKKVNNIVSYLQMAKDLNIPVYNVKNKESAQKVAEYVKNL